MPNIHTQDAPDLTLRPSELGVDSTAAAARRLGAYGNQIAAAKQQTGNEIATDIRDVGQVAENYFTSREISKGSADGAQLALDLTNKWNATAKNADPNDSSVAQKFNDEVLQPELDKFSSGFSTARSEEWAQHFTDQLRQHMFAKAQADMSTLAGIAVKNNAVQTVNSLGSMVASDPSSLDFALDAVDHKIGGMADSSPNLTPEAAANVKNTVTQEAKQNIVKAAVAGMIQKNPNIDLDAVQKKYGQYINGAEIKMFENYARQQVRADHYDIEWNRRREKEIAQDKSTEATNQYLIDVRSQDPKLANDPTAKRILNDPTLTKTDKNNLLNYIDRQLKPETQTQLSQQTFVGLLRDLRQPNADTDAIMQKAWDARLMDPGKPGSMTEHDFDQFRNEVVARKTPEGAALERDRAQFFKQYQGAINGGAIDPLTGSPKLYNAEQDARRMESMLRQKGLDPHLAYDPASEYFLGRPERIAKWQQSMQQDLQDRASFNQRFGNLPPASSPANSGMFDRVTTKAEYAALPVGHRYIGKDGRLYEKR